MELFDETKELENELKLYTGIELENKSKDKRLHNQFLQHILDFEKSERGPRQLLINLFSDDFTLPSSATLSDDEITAKLDFIENTLNNSGVYLAFKENVPDRIIYDFLLQEALSETEIPLEKTTEMNLYIDGCDGCCSSCFQKDYCSNQVET